jgi:hypothetical protein
MAACSPPSRAPSAPQEPAGLPRLPLYVLLPPVSGGRFLLQLELTTKRIPKSKTPGDQSFFSAAEASPVLPLLAGSNTGFRSLDKSTRCTATWRSIQKRSVVPVRPFATSTLVNRAGCTRPICHLSQAETSLTFETTHHPEPALLVSVQLFHLLHPLLQPLL